MNPEQLLDEVAAAIKHRTISTTHRWSVVYYYERITCIPSYTIVPPEIIIGEFTDEMARNGFTVQQWSDIKNRVILFYKELHK